MVSNKILTVYFVLNNIWFIWKEWLWRTSCVHIRSRRKPGENCWSLNGKFQCYAKRSCVVRTHWQSVLVPPPPPSLSECVVAAAALLCFACFICVAWMSRAYERFCVFHLIFFTLSLCFFLYNLHRLHSARTTDTLCIYPAIVFALLAWSRVHQQHNRQTIRASVCLSGGINVSFPNPDTTWRPSIPDFQSAI